MWFFQRNPNSRPDAVLVPRKAAPEGVLRTVRFVTIDTVARVDKDRHSLQSECGITHAVMSRRTPQKNNARSGATDLQTAE